MWNESSRLNRFANYSLDLSLGVVEASLPGENAAVERLQPNYRTVYNLQNESFCRLITGVSAGQNCASNSHSGDGALAGRPSIVSDYVSVMLRAIEATQNDPARLRSLVYDVARLSLGKQLLTSYQQLGSAGLQRHVFDLETAINQVENIAQKRIEDFSQKPGDHSAQQSEAGSGDLVIQLIEDKIIEPDHTVITVRDSFGGEVFEDVWSDRTPVVVRSGATEVYGKDRQVAELLPPLEVWEPTFGGGPKRTQANFPWGVQLLTAVLIGTAIYVATLVGSNFGGRFAVSEQAASAAPPPPAKPIGGGAQALGFPLPSVYGVYAVSEGKLLELDPLQLKVPDPRVAISAMISDVSRVKIADGKPQFIIFRRDLVSSAPTEVFVRVVARVAREMKFNEAGPPVTTDIDGQWAIRSKSYEFRVAPVGDNPEMIVLHPADPQLSLSPGRYALVVAGKGYDFTVGGQVTDTAQCLERTDVLGGAVYSECRTLPAQLEN
jgi:hypothetical protein